MATLDLGKIKQVWRGTYNNSTAYVVDDLVAYTDSGISSTYICVANSTGNAPSSSGTAHASWNYVAKGVSDPIPSQSGNSGKFLTSNGSATSWGVVASDTDFAQWRVNTLFSGAADPITNWTQSTNNCTFTESSGIFTFPSTGYWRIHMHLYGYYNSDSDNSELHIMRTTNNSSYTTKCHSYTSLNNDDGGNLYTTLEGDLVFDVTDTSTHKIKFKIANTGIYWAADANRNDTYAIFMKLGDT